MSKQELLIHTVCPIYALAKSDRKDLFQEIVIQRWKAYPRFEGLAKISTRVYRVAINTTITSLRKQKDWITSYEPATLPPLDEVKETREEEERLQLLYEAIAKLNEIERTVVMLFLEDCNCGEME